MKTTNQVRLDLAALGPPKRIGNTIHFSARVARSGEMRYGDQVETRDDAETRSIVQQLPGKPITINHPDGMLLHGAQHPIVGVVARAWFERGDDHQPAHAAAELRISDPAALSAITDGNIRQISLGYVCNVVDGKQTDIKIDHVAIVPFGRCGGSCSLRADCAACGGTGTARVDDELDDDDSDECLCPPDDPECDECSGDEDDPDDDHADADEKRAATRLRARTEAAFYTPPPAIKHADHTPNPTDDEATAMRRAMNRTAAQWSKPK